MCSLVVQASYLILDQQHLTTVHSPPSATAASRPRRPATLLKTMTMQMMSTETNLKSLRMKVTMTKVTKDTQSVATPALPTRTRNLRNFASTLALGLMFSSPPSTITGCSSTQRTHSQSVGPKVLKMHITAFSKPSPRSRLREKSLWIKVCSFASVQVLNLLILVSQRSTINTPAA